MKLQKVLINNKQYLFSKTLPKQNKNYYVYDIRHSDDDWNQPVSIEPFVLVNKFGHIFTRRQLKFPANAYIKISSFKFLH